MDDVRVLFVYIWKKKKYMCLCICDCVCIVYYIFIFFLKFLMGFYIINCIYLKYFNLCKLVCFVCEYYGYF